MFHQNLKSCWKGRWWISNHPSTSWTAEEVPPSRWSSTLSSGSPGNQTKLTSQLLPHLDWLWSSGTLVNSWCKVLVSREVRFCLVGRPRLSRLVHSYNPELVPAKALLATQQNIIYVTISPHWAQELWPRALQWWRRSCRRRWWERRTSRQTCPSSAREQGFIWFQQLGPTWMMKCVIGRPPVSVGLFHLNVTDLLSKSTIPAKLKWVLKKQRASKNIDLTGFSWLAWRLVRSLGLHRLRLKKRTLNSSGWKFLLGGTKSFRIGSCRLVFHLNRGWLSLLVDRIHLKPKYLVMS